MDLAELDNNNANYNILALRTATRAKISSLLNPLKLLRNEKGIPRDWQGFAELCGISGELIPSISHDQDPTARILKLWSDQAKADATVDKLLNYLEQIDRSDVVDDLLPLIAEDVKLFKKHPPNGKTVQAFDLEADKHILTRDDVYRISEGLDPQLYDAFVLFAEDDIVFATELIETMEKNYDFKFCVKERDLVVGGSEHDAVIKLIAERCGRLIVIISPAFLQSNANTFFYSLAQSISIEQRARKIIPCLYKDCGKLPPELDCYFKLDIRRSGTFWNFWDKLRDSIKMPEKPRAKLSLPENSLFREIDRNPELLRVGNTVSRSASNSEQSLSPAGLKSSLHKDTDSPRHISQSVKFSSSMTNLPYTEVPEDNIVPSTSANNLGSYEEKPVKKSFSFLRKFRSLVPKSKSEKQRLTGELQIEKPENGSRIENVNDKVNHITIANDNKNRKVDTNVQKKKKFSLRRKKKTAVLADT